jgi:hypothetical protein
MIAAMVDDDRRVKNGKRPYDDRKMVGGKYCVPGEQSEGGSQANAHCKHFLDLVHFSASSNAKGVVTKEK